MSTNQVPEATKVSLIPASEIHQVLATQLIVAWAGETTEARRLGWWRSDLTGEFGGQDLFQRLLPHTWQWATLQGAREAAQKRDGQLRQQESDPDRVVTLFFMGHDLDERLDERLQDFKRAAQSPHEALPALGEIVDRDWDLRRFGDWVQGHGDGNYTTTSVGRRIKGNMPESLELRLHGLIAALWPLEKTYPLPHYRRAT